MATKTRAEMITLLLERIGVKGGIEAAAAEDSALAGTVIDSLHDRLRKLGLASYATSAFPEWAQMPFVEIAGAECKVPFRLPAAMAQELESDRQHGMRETIRQMAGFRHPMPIVTDYF